jgi:hypothetical protein
MFRVFAIFLIAMLCGCATGAADKGMMFDSNSSKAVVVLGWTGLDGWRGRSVGISFRGVDTANHLDKRTFFVSNGNGWEAMKPIEYFVLEVDPGAYVANSTVSSNGVQQLFASFCLGTVRFEASAGKAVYIGNFEAPEGLGAVTASPPDFEAAKVKLSEYPGVKEALAESLMRKSPYPDSECRRGF